MDFDVQVITQPKEINIYKVWTIELQSSLT
jgi:hypothetical protein